MWVSILLFGCQELRASSLRNALVALNNGDKAAWVAWGRGCWGWWLTGSRGDAVFSCRPPALPHSPTVTLA